MKIYFSHGKESGPQGSKIRHLSAMAEAQGCDTESLDYTGVTNPDRRVDRLLTRLQAEPGEFVLVGSSMGGYVSLVAAESLPPRGLFLLAPALYMPGYGRQSYRPRVRTIEIVHGWSDHTIPPANSIKFAAEADCTLHLISGDHRLISSLATVSGIFREFVRRLVQE